MADQPIFYCGDGMSKVMWRPMSIGVILAMVANMQANDTPGSPAPLRIYADFSGGHSHGVLSALQSELSIIMQPLRLHFDWRDLKSATGRDPVPELVVVSFKGYCGVGRAPGREGKTGPLGWTHMADGEFLPFVDVSCDRVLAVIRSLIRGESLRKQELALGRALARVMAHELYHLFAETVRHARAGAAKAGFNAFDLVSEDFHFRTEEYELLWRSRQRLFQAGASTVSMTAADTNTHGHAGALNDNAAGGVH